MDLVIEHVESLTLNLHGSKPSPGIEFSLKPWFAGPGAGSQAETSTTPLAAKPPLIGQPWPGQGGIYAGTMRGINGQPDYPLIVAAGPEGEIANVEWGAYGTEEPGAACGHDGLANTKALVASTNSHPAAERAFSLSIDGHTDWYLPSRRELALCMANVPEVFSKGWHWSSTQYSRLNAWHADFDDGRQYGNVKSAQLLARAVRRFNP